MKIMKKWLSPEQRAAERSCSRYGELCALHLASDVKPEFQRDGQIRERLCEALALNSEKEAMSDLSEFFDKVYGTLPGVIKKEAGKTARTKCERFVRWFFGNSFKVLKRNRTYMVSLDGEIIKGSVDLLCEDRDGLSVAMCIHNGKNPFSDVARNPENKTGNAVTLLSCMVGLGGNVRCMNIYLTSKDDKSKKLVEEFEMRKGKNVAEIRPVSRETALESLREALGISCKRDCGSCSKRTLCRTEMISPPESVPVKRHASGKGATRTQSEVIAHTDGPLAVLAVPGSGKTRCLTERSAALVRGGVRPERLYIVTFTRKAAAELKARTASVSRGGKHPDVNTFHGHAMDIIREDGGERVLERVATTRVKCMLLEKALMACPLIKDVSYEYMAHTGGLMGRLLADFEEIQAVGRDLWNPEDVDREGILCVFDKYTEFYMDGGYFEYDDMVPVACGILEDPEILRKWRSRYDYFMVDEFQDVSEDQFRLIQMLSGDKDNLVAVGDDDQSIYGWRKGTSKFLREFTKYYPSARVVYMEDNFRSTKEILSCASSLISNNKDRHRKHINAVNTEGSRPGYAEFMPMADLVRFLKNGSRFKPEETVIIARKNTTLEKIGEAMKAEGMKFIPSITSVRDTPEFGLLMCFLRYVKDGAETPTEYLYRLLKYTGIEDVMVDNLYRDYFGDNVSEAVDAALGVLESDLPFREMLEKVFFELTGLDPTPAYSALLDRCEEEGVSSWESVLELLKDMDRFTDDSKEVEYPLKPGHFNLLTAHKSKGKEFPFVVIFGLSDFEDTAEERNLLYVAMTRAEKELLIVQDSVEIPMLLQEIGELVPVSSEALAV